MTASPQPPDIAPDPAMAQGQAHGQASSSSRQSTPSTAPIGHPSPITQNIPDPPTPPSFKGLNLVERNALKREYEKSVYKYMSRHGTLSTIDICGPCERTNTPCIRLPTMKKCSLCYRGHDVCEIWDASVTNINRRRFSHPQSRPKQQKKDKKKGEEKTTQSENVDVSLDEWAFHFEETKNILSEQKTKEREELTQKLRTALFPKSKLVPALTKISPDEEKQSKKRKQPTTAVSSGRLKKKLTKLKPTRLRPKKKLITLKINGLRTAKSKCTTPSLNSSEAPIKTRPRPPVRSASAIEHDLQVRKVHDEGTIIITPCLRCVNSLKQCIKFDLSGTCSSCLYIRQKCEGAVEMGKWVDSEGKRVWENNTTEEVVRYRAAVDLSEKISFPGGLPKMSNVGGIESDKDSSEGTGSSDDRKEISGGDSSEPVDKCEVGILGVGKDDLHQQPESLTPASQLHLGFDISEVRKELSVMG